MLAILFGALFIGLTLGLLGSGGSIITVPLLTYVIGEPPKVAIAESLIIVGAIAAVGAWRYHQQKMINWSLVWRFGLPSMLGTYLGAWASQFVDGNVQLTVFAVVMLLASRFMLKPIKVTEGKPHSSGAGLIVAAVLVGALAGFVGVGGGFLIVPALLLLGNLRMQQAIATSLSIIVLQSVVGAAKYLWLFSQMPDKHINVALVASMVVIGAVGSVTGAKVASKLPQHLLKRIFGSLLIVVAVGMLVHTYW